MYQHELVKAGFRGICSDFLDLLSSSKVGTVISQRMILLAFAPFSIRTNPALLCIQDILEGWVWFRISRKLFSDAMENCIVERWFRA